MTYDRNAEDSRKCESNPFSLVVRAAWHFPILHTLLHWGVMQKKQKKTDGQNWQNPMSLKANQLQKLKTNKNQKKKRVGMAEKRLME